MESAEFGSGIRSQRGKGRHVYSGSKDQPSGPDDENPCVSLTTNNLKKLYRELLSCHPDNKKAENGKGYACQEDKIGNAQDPEFSVYGLTVKIHIGTQTIIDRFP